MDVISASRRTDLPAFYWRWFMNRIGAGSCDVAHPWNLRQVRRVSLRPDDVTAIVFWTRNAREMLPDVGTLERAGFAFYVHYTITGYSRELEPHVPAASEAVATLRALSERIGSERIVWRYDPIVFSDATPPTYHVDRFADLAHALRGAAATATISFCDPYAKTVHRLAALSKDRGWKFQAATDDVRAATAAQLAAIAAECGMALQSCAEPDLAVRGVSRGRCVDPDLIARLRPDLSLSLRGAPTRPGCGCAASVDVGAYDTCVYGCAYCYATGSLASARRNQAEHDPDDSILWSSKRVGGGHVDSVDGDARTEA
jgi:hypothetical protein